MNRDVTQITDELLVISAQSGKEQAMQLLVKRWNPRLLAHAIHVIKEVEPAHDIVQEAWISIVSSLHKLNDPTAFRAWAYKIVHHRAVDWIRKSQKRRKTINDFAVSEKSSREESQQKDGMREDLSTAINKLPADQKLLLRMYYTNEMHLKEISTVLDVPVGTLKFRLFKIRQELKQQLEGE